MGFKKKKLKTDLNQSCFYDPVINGLTREEKNDLT